MQVDVGGTEFNISQEFLDRYPESVLTKSLLVVTDKEERVKIDRSARYFQTILDFSEDEDSIEFSCVSHNEIKKILIEARFFGIEPLIQRCERELAVGQKVVEIYTREELRQKIRLKERRLVILIDQDDLHSSLARKLLEFLDREKFHAKRSLSSSSGLGSQQHNQVRVRFAPSPTGHIHLGGLRTALYNYIFARQHGGRFILRIEDTDRTRIVPGSAEEIENVLHWAGLVPDESPLLGGNYGPYVQSRRLELYKRHAEKLVDEGRAYRCFCSPTRLDLLRKFQSRNRQKPRYDGKCRNLTEAEIQEKMLESNNKFVIRFSLQDGTDSFEDLIYKSISANLVEALEGDPVILKSDEYPTYHLASVVDDHHMKISHVLRGSEWISSTIKHVQLYKAFGWEPPQFAHFPLITLRDGSKMSKRNNHSHLQTWIDNGYQPDTLFNFLTNTGGGVPKSKQDLMEFWTLDQLVKGFDFSQVTVHPGSLDTNRLAVYSAKELKMTWEKNPEKVLQQFRQLMQRKSIKSDMDEASIKAMIGQLIDRLTSLNDLFSTDFVFVWRQPELTWGRQDYADWNIDLITRRVSDLIDGDQFEDKGKFSGCLKALAQEQGLEYSELMRFIRKIVTNCEQGLPVNEIFQLLGKTRSKQYLLNGLSYLNKTP